MKTALIIAFIVISLILAVIVLMQEGKGGGLTNTVTGTTETYWGKNKGKSKEAILTKITIVLGVLYMGLAIFLCSKWI